MGRISMAVTAASLVLALAGCRAQAAEAPAQAGDRATADLQQKTARFAVTDLGANLSALPANEREALGHMVRAAQVMDALFLEQVWSGNETTFQALVRDESPLGRVRLHAFLVNKGPWSRLDHNEAFVPGVPEKPAAANFYPAGATKVEVEAWIATLPPAERTRATGFFSTIRRGPDGDRKSVV